MPPKIRDVLQQLKDAGWQQVGQRDALSPVLVSVYQDWMTAAGEAGDDEIRVISLRQKRILPNLAA